MADQKLRVQTKLPEVTVGRVDRFAAASGVSRNVALAVLIAVGLKTISGGAAAPLPDSSTRAGDRSRV